MTASFDRTPDRWDWLPVALGSLVVFLLAHRHALLSPFVINDDVRQQLFWMARWLDPGLYPPDLLNAYAAAYVPDGVKALYFLAAKGVGLGPILFSKLLTGALFVALAVVMRSIGATLGGRRLGWICAAMVWVLPFFLKNISGGLSRSFAPPLLALFILAWLRRNAGLMAATLLVEALCIPYMAVACAGCACLDAAVSRLCRRQGPAFPARPWHLVVIALAAVLVWRFTQAMTTAGFGPLAMGRKLLDRPELTAAGRLDLFPLPNPFFDLVYWPFEGIGLFLDIGLFSGIASLAALLPLLIRGARRAPWAQLAPKIRPLAFLLAGSLVLYLAARVLALALFVPDRYIMYTINLLYALGLAICLDAALDSLLERKEAGLVLLLLAVGLGGWRLTDASLYDYRGDAPLYAAVASLPKDALLAGNPELLDNVLTFGRRNVLASFELAHPWSLGYWHRLVPRLTDQIEAYYAKDARTVVAVAKAHGITHFVVRDSDFAPKVTSGHPLFAPFDARIRELAAMPGDFALLDGKKFPYTRIEPDIRLVDVRPFLSHPDGSPPNAP
jgi:hypothetical protein